MWRKARFSTTFNEILRTRGGLKDRREKNELWIDLRYDGRKGDLKSDKNIKLLCCRYGNRNNLANAVKYNEWIQQRK